MRKNEIKSLKTDIEIVFPIHLQHKKIKIEKKGIQDELSFQILSFISRNDGCTAWKILNGLSTTTKNNRRSVEYRLEKFLVPNGFVRFEERKNHQGIKNAFSKGKAPHPKEYHLTLKGLIASIPYCPLKENQIVQKWISSIDNPNSILSGKILEFVEIEMLFFIKFHALKKIPLHMMDKIERWVSTIQNVGLDRFEKNEQDVLEKLRLKSNIRRADLDEEFRFCEHPKLIPKELQGYVEFWQYSIGGLCNGWTNDKNFRIIKKMISDYLRST